MSNQKKDFSSLHFSDLHSHKNKSYDLTHALARLIDFLHKNADKLKCDYVFIMGDIANRCDYFGHRRVY